MAIYTHFFTPVEFVECRIISIWMERGPGYQNRHETKPKRIKKTTALEEVKDMQATLRVLDPLNGEVFDPRIHMKPGTMIRDGAWEPIVYLKADEGWKEIVDTFAEKIGMTATELNAAVCG